MRWCGGNARQNSDGKAGNTEWRAKTVELNSVTGARSGKRAETWYSLFASGNTCCAITTTFRFASVLQAPLDLTKIRFQVSWAPVTVPSVLGHIRDTATRDGIRALWRGNGAAALRVFPYAAVQLSANDVISGWMLRRRQLQEARTPPPLAGKRGRGSELSVLERAMAGAMAGVTSVVATYPLDLVRARLAVQGAVVSDSKAKSGAAYRGIAHALRSIVSHEGLQGLFRGAPATLIGIIPYSATSFGVFSSVKASIRQRCGREPTTVERLLAGALAGLLGQTVGYPLDVIRRRQQTAYFLRLNQEPPLGGDKPPLATGKATHSRPQLLSAGAHDPRQGTWSTARSIVQAEGCSALWKGVTLNWIKGPIAVAVSFSTFDLLKQLFGVQDGATR